ncbi:MAG TPA: response regulator transcription factor [Solirubrobacterales bacterium]|nr:response regulator transcription factor [Solirubrobacterales bacterium]
MAVLSEPIADPRGVSDRTCAVLAAHSKTRERIESELRASEEIAEILFVAEAAELIELGEEAPGIAVLVCDLDRPAAMAMLRRVRRELARLAIVIVSPPATATGVRRGLDAGADAIVFEPLIESTLAVTVSAVVSGQAVVPRELRASVQRPTLSHRERQVLTYVCEGLTNSQIAEELFLSESTVKSHLSSAFAKFGVRSRREAAALFLEFDQTTPSEVTT